MSSTILGFAIAAAIAWFVIRAPIRVAVGVLFATTFLVPGTLLVPGSTSGYSTIHRLVLALFLLNLGRKVTRGELSGAVFLPTRLTAALGLWVALTFAIGVAMAETTYPIASATFLWVFVVEYAVFFFAIVAATRAIGPWSMARIVSTVIVIASGVAIYEHLTGFSYARWLAEAVHAPAFQSIPRLSSRGGDVRVQAGFEFALGYAWAATILLPLVIVVATRARARILRLAPALVALSIAWTYARSAYVGVAAGLLLLVITSRVDRRILALAGAGLIAAVGFAFATGAYDRTFASAEGEGSTQAREQRIPLILSRVAERPITGAGLGSLGAAGIRTTDSLFLLTYAELGVIGVAGLGLLLASTAAWTARAIRAGPPDRLLGAAALCGVLLGIASGAFVDDFTVSGLARSFWVMAAIGAVVAAQVPRVTHPVRIRVLPRALIPVVGAGVGIVLFALAPSDATLTLRFTTMTPADNAVGQAPSPFAARLVLNTACEIIEARVEAFDHDAQCYDLQTAVGSGEVRFEAPTAAAVRRDLLVAAGVVRRQLPSVRFFRLDAQTDVRATWVRTAPVWLAFVGLAVAALLPPVRRRSGPWIRRSAVGLPAPA